MGGRRGPSGWRRRGSPWRASTTPPSTTAGPLPSMYAPSDHHPGGGGWWGDGDTGAGVTRQGGADDPVHGHCLHRLGDDRSSPPEATVIRFCSCLNVEHNTELIGCDIFACHSQLSPPGFRYLKATPKPRRSSLQSFVRHPFCNDTSPHHFRRMCIFHGSALGQVGFVCPRHSAHWVPIHRRGATGGGGGACMHSPTYL